MLVRTHGTQGACSGPLGPLPCNRCGFPHPTRLVIHRVSRRSQLPLNVPPKTIQAKKDLATKLSRMYIRSPKR